MDIPNISELKTEKLSISGKGFKTIKYENGKDCYVRVPEYVCESGIEIQTFNNVPKAYMILKSDSHDSDTFSAVNTWLRKVVDQHFPHAEVHPLGNNGYLKTKIEIQDDTLDVVIFDEQKQKVDYTIIQPNSRISSICMLTGVWCMNDTASLSMRVMQMRVFPPLVASLNTNECLIVDEEEDMLYVPFHGEM